MVVEAKPVVGVAVVDAEKGRCRGGGGGGGGTKSTPKRAAGCVVKVVFVVDAADRSDVVQ